MSVIFHSINKRKRMSYHLTDRPRKNDNCNIQYPIDSEVGGNNKVLPNTVQAIVKKDPTTAEKCKQKMRIHKMCYVTWKARKMKRTGL